MLTSPRLTFMQPWKQSRPMESQRATLSRFVTEPERKPEREMRTWRETVWKWLKMLERAMGFEPTTTCLGSKDSTTELRPPLAESF